MSIEIDCPDCGGPYGPKHISGVAYCGNCDVGKITVYTEDELQEEIKEACAEYANTKLYQEGYRSGVKEEREACAVSCDKIDADNVKDYKQTNGHHYYRGKSQGAVNCAEAIRARGNE